MAIDIERMLNWELDPTAVDTLDPVLLDERGRRYLAPDTVRIPTTGSAGQSYAAFCNDGMYLVHAGTCNDGVGKSMSGGTVVVRSPGGGSSAAGDNVLIGNKDIKTELQTAQDAMQKVLDKGAKVGLS